MGEPTTRITAQDFVTPPELAAYRLASEGAGRIGGARLELAGGETHLAGCYQQVPVRVLCHRFGRTEPALVYLLNPTAGLFDGDAQLIDIYAGPGSRAFVTGQAATRIHPCLHGFSTQHWRVRVDAGATAVILPGPAIPFHGCRYYQRVEVRLAEGAHLVWGDIWLAGRYARGADSERFQFRTIVQDLTVWRTGRLLFRDRFCWQGPWDDDAAAWHFGGATAYGSVFSTLDTSISSSEPAEDGESSALRVASFLTANKHTCVRWLGPVQEVSAAAARSALTWAARAEGRPEPWLLGAHDLAPNHWFSGFEG